MRTGVLDAFQRARESACVGLCPVDERYMYMLEMIEMVCRRLYGKTPDAVPMQDCSVQYSTDPRRLVSRNGPCRSPAWRSWQGTSDSAPLRAPGGGPCSTSGCSWVRTCWPMRGTMPVSPGQKTVDRHAPPCAWKLTCAHLVLVAVLEQRVQRVGLLQVGLFLRGAACCRGQTALLEALGEHILQLYLGSQNRLWPPRQRAPEVVCCDL